VAVYDAQARRGSRAALDVALPPPSHVWSWLPLAAPRTIEGAGPGELFFFLSPRGLLVPQRIGRIEVCPRGASDTPLGHVCARARRWSAAWRPGAVASAGQ